jgi:RNA polymerase sigma factor (sigma-70 family)
MRCERFAGRAVRRRIEVDDLVQEVLVRALGHPGGLPPVEEGEQSLWRFLVTIARHVVIDAARAIRARKRDGTLERLTRGDWSRGSVRESRVEGREPGASTVARLGEEAARLRAAFERLTPEHRRVIGLRQFEGLSAREAAERLGRGETAVHSLYRRALEAWEVEVGRRG